MSYELFAGYLFAFLAIMYALFQVVLGSVDIPG